MFKRNPRSYLRIFIEFFYPRGGWYRAARYVIHRLYRLPDPAHRISRGIAAGVFVCFTPFFGLHFVSAAILAFIMRGNILAAILATFVGNPITFPFIAELSTTLGSRLLGMPVEMHLPQITQAFWHALGDIGHNIRAMFNDDHARWGDLVRFWQRVMFPYLIGGIVPGVIAGTVAYALSRPVITAYQKRRIRKLKARYAKRMAQRGGDTKQAKAGNESRHKI